jgi:hypothetical protein
MTISQCALSAITTNNGDIRLAPYAPKTKSHTGG